jgi:hypothetical protein
MDRKFDFAHTHHERSKFMISKIIQIFSVILLLVASASAFDDEVVRWNRIANDAAVAAQTDPMTESRIFTILHVAIHDAVNAIDRRYEPYRAQTLLVPGAWIDAAIAAAAHATLIQLMPAAKTTFDAAYEETLQKIADSG